MSTPLIVVGVVVLFVFFMVLGAINKRKRDDAWRQLANELGANFIQGGFMRSSAVQMPFKEWTITLDVYSVSSGDSNTSYTRLKTLLKDMQGFQFFLFRKSVITKIDKALGAKDIAFADPEFDRAFVIRGSDPARVQALFSSQRICQLFLTERASLTGSLRKNLLSLEILGEVKDVERLKTFFAMFQETLLQLQK